MAGEKARRAHHDFDKVIKWLYECRSHGYYGEINLKLADGEFTDVRPSPTCKPGEELPIVRPRRMVGT